MRCTDFGKGAAVYGVADVTGVSHIKSMDTATRIEAAGGRPRPIVVSPSPTSLGCRLVPFYEQMLFFLKKY